MVKKIIAKRPELFPIINGLILCCLVFITFYPMYNVFIVSISSGYHVARGDITFWPKEINFDAYEMVFRHPDIWRSYLNTIIYTVVGVAIQITCTVLCAYPLSRPDFFGRKFFNFFIVFTMFVGGGMIPMYLLIRNLKMINTMWALVLPGAISTYNMLIMRTSFSGIPASLTESAYIDGANDVNILWNIILPLSTPVIAVLSLYYAVGHWNSFFPALIYLRDKELYPLQIILRSIVALGNVDNVSSEILFDSAIIATNFKYAVIIVAVVPILFVYPFLQKYFTKGAMIGAVKG